MDKEKDILCKDIQAIKDADEEDVDIIKYLKYSDDIKEKQMYCEFEKLFG